MRSLVRSLAAFSFAFALTAPAFADVGEVHISRQPGLVYLPIMVLEQEHLLEKAAKKHGIDNLKVTFQVINSGGADVDALLSGNVDLATSGATNLLTGSLPLKTQVAAVNIVGRIESDDTTSAAAVSTVLLLVAFVVLVGLDLVQRRGAKRD